MTCPNCFLFHELRHTHQPTSHPGVSGMCDLPLPLPPVGCGGGSCSLRSPVRWSTSRGAPTASSSPTLTGPTARTTSRTRRPRTTPNAARCAPPPPTGPARSRCGRPLEVGIAPTFPHWPLSPLLVSHPQHTHNTPASPPVPSTPVFSPFYYRTHNTLSPCHLRSLVFSLLLGHAVAVLARLGPTPPGC